jgi:hypothetical protein
VPCGEVVELLCSPLQPQGFQLSDSRWGKFVRVRRAAEHGGHEGWTRVQNVRSVGWVVPAAAPEPGGTHVVSCDGDHIGLLRTPSSMTPERDKGGRLSSNGGYWVEGGTLVNGDTVTLLRSESDRETGYVDMACALP